ncbi:MAG: hypothetical protein ACXAC5_02185 [Promethearchaeota archaeon]
MSSRIFRPCTRLILVPCNHKNSKNTCPPLIALITPFAHYISGNQESQHQARESRLPDYYTPKHGRFRVPQRAAAH